MELRPELCPSKLDDSIVSRLTDLAARIDGANPGLAEEDVADFNRLAGTAIPYDEFQGISGGEDHDEWVRRTLILNTLHPVDLSRDEMAEIVARALKRGPDQDFYIELFRVNCSHRSTTDLLFWPNQIPELPKDRRPTPEEIADIALS